MHMRRNSFFVRLFLTNLALVLVTALLAGYVASRLLNDQYRQVQIEQQMRTAELAAVPLADEWDMLNAAVGERMDHFCKTRLGDALGAMRLTVIAPDGRVLGDSSDVPADSMERHDTADRPEVLAALAGREGLDERHSETLGLPMVYYARPLVQTGNVVAAVRVAMPVRELAQAGSFVRQSLLLAAGVAVVVTALFGLWASWRWYVPLRSLSKGAAAFAEGHLGRKIHVRGAAELEDLGASLNRMRQGLQEQMALIAGQRANLQTVLQNLAEGIVATDASDRVVLINQAAQRILTIEEEQAVGNHIQQAIRVAAVVDLYDEVRRTGQAGQQLFDLDHPAGGLTFQARISPVNSEQLELGLVIVLRDVTEVTRTLEMKSEFVSNAAHELRTPLAAIRAATDALGDADDLDEARHIAAILDRQSTRLELLTRDLLDFSALEDRRQKPDTEPIVAGDLAEQVHAAFDRRAADAQVRLEVACPAPEAVFGSDPRLVQLALWNLIDNALKFTQPDDDVTVRIEPQDGGVLLSVADTGAGIAKRDQARVFDRFYQADPARTGDLGQRGTGLGLAIVKHVAARLGGQVRLHSLLGKGTTVELDLPEGPQKGPDGV